MSKLMVRLFAWLHRRSPETKQIIIGAGLAFDPLPRARYETFERSDRLAMLKDRIAVFGVPSATPKGNGDDQGQER